MQRLTPNLIVEDVNKTIKFYQDVLNFETMLTVPETGIFNWAMVKNGNVIIMFQAKANIAKEFPEFNDIKTGASLTLYIDVKDIHELYEKIKDKVEIIKDLHPTFYGTDEFAVKDCNGYILSFAQNR